MEDGDENGQQSRSQKSNCIGKTILNGVKLYKADSPSRDNPSIVDIVGANEGNPSSNLVNQPDSPVSSNRRSGLANLLGHDGMVNEKMIIG